MERAAQWVKWARWAKIARASLAMTGAVAVVAACTSTTESSVGAEQACADFASATCGRLDACAKLLAEGAYGDAPSCKARLTGACRTSLTAPKTAATPDVVEGCAHDLNGYACGDLLAGALPPSCTPQKGGVANGGACTEDAQCQSAFCTFTAENPVCGTCAVAPTEGQGCVNRQCPQGLKCDAQNRCATPARQGESCDDSRPCAGVLGCFQGKCTPGGKAGDSCDGAAGAPFCDLVSGAVCDPAKKRCVDLRLANGGEPCGIVGNDLVGCVGTHYCKRDPKATQGTCAPRAQDGAGCDPDPTKGASCLVPAQCIGGVCRVKDPATCK